jgi:3' terminal RNA ribose 2'-O-methyltransferase Hen1
MLLTLTCTAPNAPDVGYLLGKNPASVFERPFSAGVVWVFYPEVADDHVTVALLTEIDPIGLVRGPAPLTQLGHYINDRPYVASSLTSVALNTAFGSALAGRATSHAERLSEPMRWHITVDAVACEAGEELIARLFAPLGYAIATTRLPLDPRFPAWGQADLYTLTLDGEQTVRAVLSHLYVLLPVLDNSKHYYVGAEEAEKLLAHGGDWLAAHPERALIAKRYLRYKRPLVQSAPRAIPPCARRRSRSRRQPNPPKTARVNQRRQPSQPILLPDCMSSASTPFSPPSATCAPPRWWTWAAARASCWPWRWASAR